MANYSPEDWWYVSKVPIAQPPVPAERSVEEKDAKQERDSERKDNRLSPTADFAVLIDTIKSEGVAYHKEEQREHREEKLREWVTVGLILVTFVAVCWQVHEMIKVNEPINCRLMPLKKPLVAKPTLLKPKPK